MRPSSGWSLADLTWACSQSRRSASAPSRWPRHWRLRRRTVCRPGVERGCARSDRVGQRGNGCAQAGRILLGESLPRGQQADGEGTGCYADRRGGNGRLAGATCFGKLDIQQRYWQMPLAAEAQEVFTLPPPKVCLPPRVCLKAF